MSDNAVELSIFLFIVIDKSYSRVFFISFEKSGKTNLYRFSALE